MKDKRSGSELVVDLCSRKEEESFSFRRDMLVEKIGSARDLI